MGLDMYLYKRTYVKNWDYMGPEHRWTITVVPPTRRYGADYEIQTDRIAYVEEEIAYWRKANQIHKWFVDNVQGGVDECQTGPTFGVEKLRELVETCKRLLVAHDGGQTLKDLPRQDGFFFGSTEIDEWYWEDLRDTVRMLEPELETADDETEFIYHSSW